MFPHLIRLNDVTVQLYKETTEIKGSIKSFCSSCHSGNKIQMYITLYLDLHANLTPLQKKKG